MPPKPPQVIAVFISKKSSTVKHWRRTGSTDTLCKNRIVAEAHPTGISRECLVCHRLKAEHDAIERR